MFDTMYTDIGNKKSWYWLDVNQFATALDEAVKAGKLRAMNTEKTAALFLDCICGLRIHRVFSVVTDTIEEDVRDLMGLFVNGLAL